MNIIFTIFGIITLILYMKKVRSFVLKGQISNDPLTTIQTILVWIFAIIFSPILTGLILYYGWKHVLPIKAKQVRKITWIVVGIYVLVMVMIFGNVLMAIYKKSSQPSTTVVIPSTTTEDLSLKEYKNDELGISFRYPSKYGEVVIKKILEGKEFIFLGHFTKNDPNFSPYFFGGKSIDNQLNNHMPSSIDDTISKHKDNIKISDISGVNMNGILLSANSEGNKDFYKDGYDKWREVIFSGNKTILNLVFFARLDSFPEYLDVVKTVKIY